MSGTLLCVGLLTPHHALTAGLPCMPQRGATGDLPVKTRGSVRRPATTEYKTCGSVRRPATTEYSTARTQAMKDATNIRLPQPDASARDCPPHAAFRAGLSLVPRGGIRPEPEALADFILSIPQAHC